MKKNGRKPKEFSVREVAERFDVSVVTIRRWIDDGYFPNAYQAGPGRTSPYRIPESDVITFEKEELGKEKARNQANVGLQTAGATT